MSKIEKKRLTDFDDEEFEKELAEATRGSNDHDTMSDEEYL
jgi:hypothetical protein